MSIQSEIDRLNGVFSDSYTAIEEMGGTIPSSPDSNNLVEAIRSIPQGNVDDVQINGSSIVVDGIANIVMSVTSKKLVLKGGE